MRFLFSVRHEDAVLVAVIFKQRHLLLFGFGCLLCFFQGDTHGDKSIGFVPILRLVGTVVVGDFVLRAHAVPAGVIKDRLARPVRDNEGEGARYGGLHRFVREEFAIGANHHPLDDTGEVLGKTGYQSGGLLCGNSGPFSKLAREKFVGFRDERQHRPKSLFSSMLGIVPLERPRVPFPDLMDQNEIVDKNG